MRVVTLDQSTICLWLEQLANQSWPYEVGADRFGTPVGPRDEDDFAPRDSDPSLVRPPDKGDGMVGNWNRRT